MSQWDETLLCNVVSHWLSPFTEWPLLIMCKRYSCIQQLNTIESPYNMVSCLQNPHRIYPTVRLCIMTSSNENIFRVTGLLWGEPTGDRWISLKKCHCGGASMSLIYASTNGWANNRDACHLRRHHTNYDVTVMESRIWDVYCEFYDASQMAVALGSILIGHWSDAKNVGSMSNRYRSQGFCYLGFCRCCAV